MAWKSAAVDDVTPTSYAGLSGVETFSPGEEVSHITIKLDQRPNELVQQNFVIHLTQPKSVYATLDDVTACDVTLVHDVALAQVDFGSERIEAKQSEGEVRVPVERSCQPQGVVRVPWRLAPESNDSVYYDVTGDVVFGEDEMEGEAVIALPQIPLSNPREELIVQLEAPVRSAAKLGPRSTCRIVLEHDLGQGTVEMAEPDVRCQSEEGEAVVVVRRRDASAFPAEVEWRAEEGSARAGCHYDATGGILKLKSGDEQRAIRLPVFNDPSGEDRAFTVTIVDVRGRDALGDDVSTDVIIENTPSEDFLVLPHLVK